MKQFRPNKILMLLIFLSVSWRSSAQTDMDAIMMEKNAFCAGGMYTYSSWKNYWEGTLKRSNENIGSITTQMIGVMGNYGVGKKLNLLFNIPYIATKASAGTLHGMSGVQDLSLMIKYRPVNKKIGDARVAVFGIAGGSTPLTNYVADFLPLSIGSRSTTAMARLMLDYYYNSKWFATASATYVYRSNIKIDRNSYYTDELILSNEVQMPNAATFNVRAGYRTQWWIAEAVFNNWTTLGGFDMTRNNMPFPSNRMNATALGINLKYVLKKVPQLSLTGGANQIIAGRNMGQSLTANGGVFYVFDFSRKSTKSDHNK